MAPNIYKTRRRQLKFLEALNVSLGIVTTAEKNCNVSRSSHYKWVASDKAYAARVQAIDERALDFVESKLHGRINAGDTAATIFYLKCRGKARGYVERVDINQHNTYEPITGITIEND